MIYVLIRHVLKTPKDEEEEEEIYYKQIMEIYHLH